MKKINIWIKFMNFGNWLGCHQLPERSFFIKGYQLPICARCTGVISGQLLAMLLIWFLQIPIYVSIIMLIPLGIDWGLQFFLKIMSTNVRRFVTGIICGFGCTYIYRDIIRFVYDLMLILL